MNIKINERELIIRNKTIFDDDTIYNKITEDSMGINKNEIHIKYLIKFIKVNNKKCYIIYNEKRNNLMLFQILVNSVKKIKMK